LHGLNKLFQVLQKKSRNKLIPMNTCKMKSDAAKIYELYVENAAKQEPTMTITPEGAKKWHLHGKLHREDGPAVEWENGDREWHLHGKRHRENDEPAIVRACGRKEWWLHGKRHRVGAPAVEAANDYKIWILHNMLHREDGPAVEWADGLKQWWLHGKQHREDGPATEYADGDKAWYLNNKRYNDVEAWAKDVLKLHNKPSDDADVNDFLRDVLTKDDLL
jgi:hypothetical protein